MGLLDKLKDSVNLDKLKDSVNMDKLKDVASDVIGAAKENVQNVLDPLASDDAKRYYEIVYGLLSSVEERFSYAEINKYVDFRLGTPCDQETLKRIVRLFYSSNENGPYTLFGDEKELRQKYGTPTQRADVIVAKNKELEKANTYRSSKEEIYSIIYSDFLEELRSLTDSAFMQNLESIRANYQSIPSNRMQEMIVFVHRDKFVALIKEGYNEVFGVIKDHGVKFFEEGVVRMCDKYKYIISKKAFEDIIHEITVAYFFEGNESIQFTLSAFFYFELYKNKKNIFLCYATALRALHYEQYGELEGEYVPLTDAECLALVQNDSGCQEIINNHPYEKEEYTQECVDIIKEKPIFTSGSVLYTYDDDLSCWLPRTQKEPRFTDAVCHYVWKEAARKFEEEPSTDVLTISKWFSAICDSIYGKG